MWTGFMAVTSRESGTNSIICRSLKVEVLYLNPMFVSPSNHKYDCQDYEHVDPHYGVIVKEAKGTWPTSMTADNRHSEQYSVRTTDMENLEASDAFFARFVQEVHKRGMRMILDGVFNHCGSFNKWMDREKIYAGRTAGMSREHISRGESVPGFL